MSPITGIPSARYPDTTPETLDPERADGLYQEVDDTPHLAIGLTALSSVGLGMSLFVASTTIGAVGALIVGFCAVPTIVLVLERVGSKRDEPSRGWRRW